MDAGDWYVYMFSQSQANERLTAGVKSTINTVLLVLLDAIRSSLTMAFATQAVIWLASVRMTEETVLRVQSACFVERPATVFLSLFS